MSIRIYADIREEKSGIPSILEASGLVVIRRQLPIGDYIVSDQVVIERKSAYDFAKSLFDGRLFEQARRMSESYPIIIYIVEGDPGRIRRFAGLHRQLYSAMATLTIDYDARILVSNGPQGSAELIASIARRIQSEGGGRVVIHKKPKMDDLESWQLYVLQSFPQVGPKTAERILERFGTVERFCRATMAELSTIPGLGEKKAENIRRILITPYRSGRKKSQGTLDEYTGQG
ncbi:MAG: helix-hairpin-helix domain-containing protein [Desulfurococcales archaeon]|nr:helix-hairpin-helix domain-containing protein [Desulfurococcales archaeon]MCE4605563.1 helix-hairpin-helix domain-containing protein [Desulfurococcales archaeon]